MKRKDVEKVIEFLEHMKRLMYKREFFRQMPASEFDKLFETALLTYLNKEQDVPNSN